MAKTKLDDALREAKQGLTRVWAKGGEKYKMGPSDKLALMGLMEFGDIGLGRDEDNTFEIPSTSDGLTTVERIASIGALTADTGTLSQLLDEVGDEPFFKLVRRQFPMLWWIPWKGETGAVGDKDDFGWASVIDKIYVRNWRQADTANPSDKTLVGQGIRWNGEYRYLGDYFHDYYPLEAEAEDDTGISRELIACAARDIANRGTEFFAISAARAAVASATPPVPAQGSQIHARDVLGNWITPFELSALDDNVGTDMFIVGGNLVIPSSGAGGHVVISIADVFEETDNSFIVTSGYESAKEATVGVARSASELIFAGLAGYIYKADSLTGGVRTVDAGSATTQGYAAISSYKRQVVAVAASNAVAVSTDFGETWVAKTGPKVSTDLSAVSMWGENNIIVGTSPSTGLAQLFYSEDFGETWVELPQSMSVHEITDIKFLSVKGEPSGVGYACGNKTASGSEAGVIARTGDGGAEWHVGGNHIKSAETSHSLNALAVGTANNVIAVGEESATDGIALVSEVD